MVDPSGNRAPVPAGDARDLFNRGWGFPTNQPIGVIEPGASAPNVISPDRVQAALDAGAELLPTDFARDLAAQDINRAEQARERQEIQQEYGGVAQGAMAFAEGLAQTMTGGQAGRLAGELGELLGDDAQEYRGRRRGRAIAQAGPRAAGGVAAIPASLLIGRNPRAAAVAESLPQGLSSVSARAAGREARDRVLGGNLFGSALGAGVRAEQAVAGVASRGLQRLGVREGVARTAGSAAGGAVGGVGANAAMRVAQELDQAELEGRNADLSLANIAEGSGEAAALGAGFNALITGALSNPAFVRRVNNAVDESWLRSAGGDRWQQLRRRHGGDGAAAIGGLGRELDILGPGRTAEQSLRRAEEVMKTAERNMDNGVDAAQRAGARLSSEDQVRIAASIDELETIARRSTGPESAEIRRVAREAISRLRSLTPPARATATQGAARLGPSGTRLGVGAYRYDQVGIRRALDVRRYFDELIDQVRPLAAQRARGGLALKDELVGIRRSLEDSVDAGFRRAQLPLGQRATLQRQYVNGRQNYEAARSIDAMLRRQTPEQLGVVSQLLRNLGWNKLSGAARRAVRGGAQGAAAGLLLDSVLGGIVTGAIFSLRGSRNVQALKAMLGDEALRFLGARRQARVIQDNMRRDIAIAATNWKPNPRLMGTVASAVGTQDYDYVADRVRQTISNPSLLRRAAEENAQQFANRAPVAAIDTIAQTEAAIQAVERALPRGIGIPTLTSTTQDPNELVSDVEKAAFMRFVHAVNNPLSVLEDIKSGMLTYESVAALREVHPLVYRELRESVRELVSSGDENVPYDMLLQLGTLFPEVPTVASLAPSMIKTLQAPYIARETGSAGGQMSQGPGPSPQPAPNIAKLEETRVQQLDSQ